MYYVLTKLEHGPVEDERRFVALDTSSGGYPHIVDSPFNARIWSSKLVALDYAQMFPNENFELFQIDYSLSKI